MAIFKFLTTYYTEFSIRYIGIVSYLIRSIIICHRINSAQRYENYTTRFANFYNAILFYMVSLLFSALFFIKLWYSFFVWHIDKIIKRVHFHQKLGHASANNRTETKGRVRLEIRQSGESIYGTLIFNYRFDAEFAHPTLCSSVRQIMRCYRFGNVQRREQSSWCYLQLAPMHELHSSGIYQGFSLVQFARSYAINA